MCGIISVVSINDNIVPDLLAGLKRLEYRGYDSAGISVYDDGKTDKYLRQLPEKASNSPQSFSSRRAVGKLSALVDLVDKHPITGRVGIGHIRWATHGAPSLKNAHPLRSENVSVVHNGIIENYLTIKTALETQGYTFYSDTDTEVIATLVQSYLDAGLTPFEAFVKTVKQLNGSYAIAVMIETAPENVFVARLGSPLLLGEAAGSFYAGSDALALAGLVSHVRYLEEGDYAQISPDGFLVHDKYDQVVERPAKAIDIQANTTDKMGFEHYMLKEIHEQPMVVEKLLDTYIDREQLKLKDLDLPFDFNEFSRLTFVGCGTAYHAGHLARYWFESFARLPVDIEMASEYRYRDLVQPEKGLFIAISQSGETADTLAAMRKAKADKQQTLALINVESATMAREADAALYTHAGREIGVASTKAFMAQIVTLLMLSLYAAYERGVLSEKDLAEKLQDLLTLPTVMRKILADTDDVQVIAKRFKEASSLLFLGRGYSYPVAEEAALKLKEISYIHAESYAAGEMKHGAIALIDKDMPVVCLCPDDAVLDKSLSNMQEVMARDAQVILVASSKVVAEHPTTAALLMPEVSALLAPMVYTVPMQLFAYYVALFLGKDVDQPRNLAKSVTVE